MNKSPSEIEIRSESVQDILNAVPTWMIKWGNTLILLVLLALLIIAALIKYPDVISAQVLVTTHTPPEELIANANGHLDVIFKSDNDSVTENEAIAVVENAALYQDVFLLKEVIETVNTDSINFYFPIEEIPKLTLGEIASDYAQFEADYYEYYLNRILNPFSNELMAYTLALKEDSKRLLRLKSQIELSREELLLKQKDLGRSKTLLENNNVSAQEFEQKQILFLEAKRALENLNSSFLQLSNDISIAKMNLSQSEIKKYQEEIRLLNNTRQSFYRLNKSIKDWEMKYVLKSSIEGRVSFLSVWNKNQFVNTGDVVFVVVPQMQSGYLGKIKAPTQNSGKLKKGQTVNIMLDNYPEEEFGKLSGTIKNISLVPTKDGFYLLDVDLPPKLTTSYNLNIEFRQEMLGIAEIITEDRALLERLLFQFRDF